MFCILRAAAISKVHFLTLSRSFGSSLDVHLLDLHVISFQQTSFWRWKVPPAPKGGTCRGCFLETLCSSDILPSCFRRLPLPIEWNRSFMEWKLFACIAFFRMCPPSCWPHWRSPLFPAILKMFSALLLATLETSSLSGHLENVLCPFAGHIRILLAWSPSWKCSLPSADHNLNL